MRITSGENAGDTHITVGPEGLTTSSDSIADVPTVIDFDPASFVLTAYGRMNAGTVTATASSGTSSLTASSGSERTP